MSAQKVQPFFSAAERVARENLKIWNEYWWDQRQIYGRDIRARPSERYTYLPLQPKQIRILKLLPSIYLDAPLECELTAGESQQYDAVSYAWGSSELSESLYIGETVKPITLSLAMALTRLRSTKDVRRLWVDAVCINQDDISEKNSQVRMMSKIYQEARAVCIMLGTLSQPIEEGALQSLNDICTKALEGGLKGGLWSSNIPRNDAIIESVCRINALRALLSLPWLNRRWTFQEFVLSQNAILFSGRAVVNWSMLLMCLDVLRHSSLMNDAVSRVIDRLQVMQNLQATAGAAPGSATLLSLLHFYHELECSDPRDRIYALQACTNDVREFEHVDYEEEVQLLYERVALAAVGTSGLEILHCAGAFGAFGGSWMPDWRRQRTYRSFMQVPDFRTTTDKTPPRIVDKKLVCKGLVVDQVVSCGVEGPTHISSVGLFVREVVQFVKEVATFSAASLQVLTRVCTAHACFMHLDQVVSTLPVREDMDGEDLFCFMLHAVGQPEDTVYRRMFDQQVVKTMSGRRVFTTECGRIGMGPCELREGDSVVILATVNTPFLLRVSGDQYEVVGDVYVDGLMKGEVQEEFERRAGEIVVV